jgi:SAM-dependent methyltransferase
MAKRGPAFYDDDAVFAAYNRTREAWPDNPNDTLEQPVMRELAGDLAGRRILDLGCGAASFGVRALVAGARSYLGVDGSRNMVARAESALAGGGGTAVCADLETWVAPVGAFDLAVSSLALHYVADLAEVLARVYGALVSGGRFVCSVEHPILTASDCGGRSGPCPDCLVDDYFVVGPREASWFGERVVKYHRTIEGYVAALQGAGFVLDRLRESAPDRERFADEAEYARRIRAPIFLFLRGHRPTTM